MKKIIFLLFVTVNVFGQSVDYNKIILPDHVQSPDFAEKLVQLAWQNNPLNEVLRSEVKIAEYAVKRNKADWWDIIHLQGNLNEFTVNKYILKQDDEEERAQRADFYPLYNVRANISLGMFVRIPYNSRINKQQVAIAESNLDARKLEIRNVVMKTYNEYILNEKIYKIQAQVFSDVENAHKLVEQKFKNGETSFEAYSASQGNYSRASIILLTAETEYKNTKLDLEKLIGIALEDVR
jgi:outer membrane protein TolC